VRAWLRLPVSTAWRLLMADLRAWRRGETRIAPRIAVNGQPVRGRVYAAPSRPVQAASAPEATITARHLRNGAVIAVHVARGRVERG
jgi:hypothetical protein